MLGIMVGNTAVVAFYTYAENIINLPKGILSALDGVMLPRISNLVANNREEEAIKKMGNSIGFNGFVSCALCFGIIGITPIFVPWFLGLEFTPTVALTMQLALVMIPMTITNVVQTQYLIPFKKERVYIKAVTLGAITNFVLNLILIPFYGATGAVIGTIIAEVVPCIYQLNRIKDIYRFRHLFTTFFPFVVCGLLELHVILLLSYLPVNTLMLLLLQVFGGGIAYIIGYVIYLIYIKKDYNNLRDLIRNIKQ